MAAERLTASDAPEHQAQAAARSLASVSIVPDEVVEQRERDSRIGDALVLLDQLPPAFRTGWALGRLERSCAPELVAAARGWTGDRSFVVLGGTGAGKSTAAAWLFRKLLAAGVNAGAGAWARARTLRWCTAFDLETAVREHKLGDGKAPLILRAKGASVLFVDDAGQEQDARPLRDVLDARYGAGLPTVLSSNMSPEQLQAHLGGAFLRKLREAGGRNPVIVDLRKGGARGDG